MRLHSSTRSRGERACRLTPSLSYFYNFMLQAGIEGASSHSGRRTFITTLANKGIGVRVLMALAGHRHMSTTQRYIDLNDEMLKVAVNLV
jgi:integrase/recombinase XerD